LRHHFVIFLSFSVLSAADYCMRGSGAGMSIRDQNRVMRNFRRGTSNLLVATSVAEEGYGPQPI
jgi:ERCC4-related helicase